MTATAAPARDMVQSTSTGATVSYNVALYAILTSEYYQLTRAAITFSDATAIQTQLHAAVDALGALTGSEQVADGVSQVLGLSRSIRRLTGQLDYLARLHAKLVQLSTLSDANAVMTQFVHYLVREVGVSHVTLNRSRPAMEQAIRAAMASAAPQ